MGEEFCVGGERNVFVVCTEAVVQIAHLAAAEVSVCRHSASSTCWGSGLRPPPLAKGQRGEETSVWWSCAGLSLCPSSYLRAERGHRPGSGSVKGAGRVGIGDVGSGVRSKWTWR